MVGCSLVCLDHVVGKQNAKSGLDSRFCMQIQDDTFVSNLNNA